MKQSFFLAINIIRVHKAKFTSDAANRIDEIWSRFIMSDMPVKMMMHAIKMK